LNMAIVSLIGKTKNSSNMFSKIFGILNMHSIDIKMISSGISYRNISFIVEDKFLEKTINLLHDELIIVK
jgi:aspartokinase